MTTKRKPQEDEFALFSRVMTELRVQKMLAPLLEHAPKPFERGWLVPYLIVLDELTWNRWTWWQVAVSGGKLPDVPIPQIPWLDAADHDALKAIHEIEHLCERNGVTYRWFEWLLDNILWALGQTRGDGSKEDEQKPPRELWTGGFEETQRALDGVLAAIFLKPYDYWGDIMAEAQVGKQAGFFPTPLTVCKMMILMNFSDEPSDWKERAVQTVCDPAVGTGRMLLVASNYSVRLYGNDILLIVLKALRVSAALWVPWLARGGSDDLEESKAHDAMHSASAGQKQITYYKTSDQGSGTKLEDASYHNATDQGNRTNYTTEAQQNKTSAADIVIDKKSKVFMDLIEMMEEEK